MKTLEVEKDEIYSTFNDYNIFEHIEIFLNANQKKREKLEEIADVMEEIDGVGMTELAKRERIALQIIEISLRIVPKYFRKYVASER